MMKRKGLGMARMNPNETESVGGGGNWRHPQDPMDYPDVDAGWRHPQDAMDPPPRKPAYPDQGGEDFDPTDPAQKPKKYDDYSMGAYKEFESIVSYGPDDSYDSREIDEWRIRWMRRAKEFGLDERKASQALDDIQDGVG